MRSGNETTLYFSSVCRVEPGNEAIDASIGISGIDISGIVLPVQSSPPPAFFNLFHSLLLSSL